MPTPAPLRISLPEPCPASRDAFVPLAGADYCHSCRKAVHDFTGYSDAELINVLRTRPSGCGTFRADQLDRDLAKAELQRRGWHLAAISVLLALQLFSTQYVRGQVPVGAGAPPASPASSVGTPSAAAPPAVTRVLRSADRRTLHVRDTTGAPVIGATVAVLDPAGQVLGGASTDTSGHATVTLPSNAHELEVSYVGFHTERLAATPGDATDVILESLTHALEAVVITGSTRGNLRGGYMGTYGIIIEGGCGDGSRKVFGECVPVPAPEPPAPVTLFPNPSPGHVTLRLPTGAQLLNVYTAHGQLVLSRPADPSYPEATLRLPAAAPAGSYIVEVVGEDGLSSAHPWQVVR